MTLVKIEVVSDQFEYIHGDPILMYRNTPMGLLNATYKISNVTRYPITFHFLTTRRFDFSIMDSLGREVIRWSKYQPPPADIIGKEIVQPNEDLVYDAEINLGQNPNTPLPLGDYTLEGILTACYTDYQNARFDFPLTEAKKFRIVETVDFRQGFIFKKLHAIGTRSEGPDYFLQTKEKVIYELIYDKSRLPWEKDPYLEKFCCKWNPGRPLKVIGDFDLKPPPKIFVKEIIRKI
jgi:hypothetical protein